jgi:hypothetical protein
MDLEGGSHQMQLELLDEYATCINTQDILLEPTPTTSDAFLPEQC